jgi:ribosomal protein L16 Arg81 hydroxylase
MTKGDLYIPRRSAHADFNIAHSEVKVSKPNA